MPSYVDPAPGAASPDAFELDGEALVVDPSDATRFHRRRSDGARIVFRSDGPNPGGHWEETRVDGVRRYYGYYDASGDGGPGDTDSSLARDVVGTRVFRWRLDRIVDPRGNEIRFHYWKDRVDGAAIQLYPASVRYTIHPNGTAWMDDRLIRFAWEARGDAQHDADWPTSYRSGFRIQTRWRLSAVRAGIDADADGELASGERVRSYLLRYAPKPSFAEPAHTPFSQLVEIQRLGRDDAVFPSRTRFDYGEVQLGFGAPEPVAGTAALPDEAGVAVPLVNQSSVALRDMNGDGYVDWVRADLGSWAVLFGGSDENGHFGFGHLDGGASGSWTPADASSPFSGAYEWQWPCTGSCGALSAAIVGGTLVDNGETPPLQGFDRRVLHQLIDMDGDGLPDRVAGGQPDGASILVYRNDGNGGFAPAERWDMPPSGSFLLSGGALEFVEACHQTTTLFPTCTMTRLFDASGDGRPDWVSQQDGVFVNNGSGFDAPALGSWPRSTVSADPAWIGATTAVPPPLSLGFSHSPNVQASTQPSIAISAYGFQDLNGDGLPDYVKDWVSLGAAEPAGIDFNTGEGWSAVTPDVEYVDSATSGLSSGAFAQAGAGVESRIGPVTTHAMADLNGDGVLDLIAHKGGPATGGTWMVYWGLGDGRFLTLVDGPPTSFGPRGVEWFANGRETPLGRLGHIRASYVGLDGAWRSGIELVDIDGDGLLDHVDTFYAGWCEEGQTPAAIADCYAYHQQHDVGWRASRNPGPTWLLRSVRNELGGTTSYVYTPSSRFAWREPVSAVLSGAALDEFGEGAGGAPPVPMSRALRPRFWISERTRHDGRAGTPVERERFRYAGVRRDVAARAQTAIRTVEIEHADASLQRLVHHQHPDLRGRVRSDERIDAQGRLLHSIATQWSAIQAESQAGAVISGVRFARAWIRRERVHDPADPAHFQEMVVARNYDTVSGMLTRTTRGAHGRVAVEERRYHPNWDAWLLGFPSEIETTLDGAIAGLVRHVYRGNASFEEPPQDGLVAAVWRSESHDGSDYRFRIERFAHDAHGNVVAEWDGASAGDTEPLAETDYDPWYRSFPVEIRRLGEPGEPDLVDRYAWDAGLGRIERTLDPNGWLSCREYDAFGRLAELREHTTARSSPFGGCDTRLARMAYHAIGDPELQHRVRFDEVDAPWGAWQGTPALERRVYFDGWGRIHQRARTAGRYDFAVERFGWDARGRPTCIGLPERTAGDDLARCVTRAPFRTRSFDPVGRIVAEHLHGADLEPLLERAHVHTIADLDADGLLDQVQTSTRVGTPDRVTARAYDIAGRVVAAVEVADGALTRFERDAAGRLTAIDGPDVAGDANRTIIAYNHRGERVSAWPAGLPVAWQFAYDASGRLVTQVSPENAMRGEQVHFVYDRLGRMRLRDLPGAADDASFIWDDASSPGGLGRLARIDGPGADTRHGYTLRGEVARTSHDFGDDLVFEITHRYDLVGRRIATQLPDGRGMSLAFSGALPSSLRHSGIVDQPSVPGRESTRVVGGLAFHASGALAAMRMTQSRLEATWSFDPTSHLPSTQRLESATATLQDLTYQWDRAGNLLAAADALGIASQVFEYDGAHRLARATSTTSPAQPVDFAFDETYAYDPTGHPTRIGDRVFSYGGVGSSPHALARVDEPGQASLHYAYDASGQAIERSDGNGVLAIARDALGRARTLAHTPVGSPSPVETQARTHDSRGRLLRTGSGASAGVLHVDRAFEVDLARGEHRVRFFVGELLVATARFSGLGTADDPGVFEALHYEHRDHAGSVVLRTDASGSGVALRPMRPFGRLAGVPIGIGVATGLGDAPVVELGAGATLFDFGQRLYDPVAARFLSPDPQLHGALDTRLPLSRGEFAGGGAAMARRVRRGLVWGDSALAPFRAGVTDLGGADERPGAARRRLGGFAPRPLRAGAMLRFAPFEVQALDAYGYALQRPTVLGDAEGESAVDWRAVVYGGLTNGVTQASMTLGGAVRARLGGRTDPDLLGTLAEEFKQGAAQGAAIGTVVAIFFETGQGLGIVVASGGGGFIAGFVLDACETCTVTVEDLN